MAEQNQINNIDNQTKQLNSKTGIGVLLGLFTGLIGLVIGLLLYKDGTYERKTFIKGWLWTFIISTIVGIIVGIIVYALYFSALANTFI